MIAVLTQLVALQTYWLQLIHCWKQMHVIWNFHVLAQTNQWGERVISISQKDIISLGKMYLNETPQTKQIVDDVCNQVQPQKPSCRA